MTTDIAPDISKAYLLSQGYKNGAFAYAIEVLQCRIQCSPPAPLWLSSVGRATWNSDEFCFRGELCPRQAIFTPSLAEHPFIIPPHPCYGRYRTRLFVNDQHLPEAKLYIQQGIERALTVKARMHRRVAPTRYPPRKYNLVIVPH